MAFTETKTRADQPLPLRNAAAPYDLRTRQPNAASSRFRPTLRHWAVYTKRNTFLMVWIDQCIIQKELLGAVDNYAQPCLSLALVVVVVVVAAEDAA